MKLEGGEERAAAVILNCLALRSVLPARAGVPFPSPLERLASSSVHFLRLPSYIQNNLSGSKG